MDDSVEISKCIDNLRTKLEKYTKTSLKEAVTRIIFIDPMLKALGWDIGDPDEVDIEHATVDGKSVDYALKTNNKVVLLIEAKPLDDPLTDVKAITQVVGYSANEGVDWCVLTNGNTYRVYKTTEKASAPEKLLFEVSLDPKVAPGVHVGQIAEQLRRISRKAMEDGVLDQLGEEVFTGEKVRKALDKLFTDPPGNLVGIVRGAAGVDSIKPSQVRDALKRLWREWQQYPTKRISAPLSQVVKPEQKSASPVNEVGYAVEHHTESKPREVIEMYRRIDDFSMTRDPEKVARRVTKQYIGYSHNNHYFCTLLLQRGGLLVWLKLKYARLENPPTFARDVSHIGHWGVGDVELAIRSVENLGSALPLIQQSYDENK
jgi:hypothetical protein